MAQKSMEETGKKKLKTIYNPTSQNQPQLAFSFFHPIFMHILIFTLSIFILKMQMLFLKVFIIQFPNIYKSRDNPHALITELQQLATHDQYFIYSPLHSLLDYLKINSGTSLRVQWLRLHSPNAEMGPGFNPWSGN